MPGLRVDIRHGLRALSRDRAFSTVAILVLALGIGANTAIFSLVHSVLLRPLAFRAPQDLYLVREVVPELSHFFASGPANARHFLHWQRHAASFESLALIEDQEPNLTGIGQPERLTAARVTPNLFAMLGVAPQHGRSFGPEDGKPGQDRIVLLTDPFWRRRFGADPALVGRTIILDDAPHVVVGILPAGFMLPHFTLTGASDSRAVDLFRPWALDEQRWGLIGEFNYTAIGRLRPGVAPARAVTELNVLQAQIAAQLKGQERLTLQATLQPLHDQVVASSRRGLWLLLAAVGSILVIACANLSHLFLVRASARRQETAIRAALGASALRLARQTIVEGLCLSLAGGIVGVLVALVGLRLLVRAAPVDVPRLDEVRLDARALAFSLAIATLTGLVCSVAAAWRQARADPQDALRSSSRSTTDAHGAARLRELLVSLEVGVSTALLIVAALLVASFLHVMRLDKGFEIERILTARISLPSPKYESGDRRTQFFSEVLQRLAATPGISSAGIVSTLPLQAQKWADVITLEGDTRPILQRPVATYRAVSGEYMRTMGIAIREGRSLAEVDRPRATAVVSAATARRLWPGQSAIGKRFRRAQPDQPTYEIVGVASDIRSELEADAGLMVYVPYWIRRPDEVSLAVRTMGDPVQVVGGLKEAVWSLDRTLPVSAIQTMAEIERRHVGQRRFQTFLVGTFAGVALLLAGLGVYSIVAYTVTCRTRELGLRLALGARPGQVMMLVMRQGLRPVAIGVVFGIAAALALGRVLSTLLFGVTPSDPTTLVGAGLFIIVATAAACWIPTRRVRRADPMDALRVD